MALTNEDVQEIVQLLDDLQAGEFHLRTRHFTLSLRRTGQGWQADGPATEPVPAEQAAAEQAEQAAAEPAPGLVPVRTPMAGTFYRAPKPGDPPYVEVGSRVDPETVVGIVETMKLMNPVHAGTGGTVAEICLPNAELAEQDAVLMRIAPTE